MIASVLVLTACGTPVDYGPVAVYDAHGVSGDPLDVTGTLRISDTCVTVPMHGEYVAVVFPQNEVRWDSATSTLTYLGHPYRDGDPIALVFGGEGGRPKNLSQECPVGRYVSVAPST